MKTLIIDTSTKSALCAVIADGARYTMDIAIPDERYASTSAAIIPTVDGVLQAAGLSPRDLDVIAAVVGPGSFTGLRIGVSMANAMATTGCATLPVGVLDVLAHGAPADAVCAVPSRVGYSYTNLGEMTVEAVGGTVSVGLEGSGATEIWDRARYIEGLFAYVEAHVGEAKPQPLAPLYLKKSSAERLRESKKDD